MTYRIARDGQLYGPYTEEELRKYLASGNILLTDLAQSEASDQWLPVGQLFPPVIPNAGKVIATTTLYPNPPDLPWWLAIIIEIFTGGLFFIAWDIVESWWMYRVNPRSIAVWLYIASAVLFLLYLPVGL